MERRLNQKQYPGSTPAVSRQYPGQYLGQYLGHYPWYRGQYENSIDPDFY